MGNNRGLLLIALAVIIYFMYDAWQRDYGPKPPQAQSEPATAVDGDPIPQPPGDAVQGATAEDVPSPVPDLQGTTSQAADLPATVSDQGQSIEIVTDVLRLTLSTQGGEIQDVALLDYPVSPNQPDNPFQLLNGSASNYYVAQSGLLSGREAPNHRTLWQAAHDRYELRQGDDKLAVSLTWVGPDGLTASKTYHLTRGSYLVDVEHAINNGSSEPWTVQPYYQLQRVPPSVDDSFSFTNPERYSYNGAAYYSPDDGYEKLGYDDIAEDGLNQRITGGWIAMVQHYFFSAWVPSTTDAVQYTAQTYQPGGAIRYIIRAMTPTVSAAAGASASTQSQLYLGPKLQDVLPDIAKGLERTVDYGIFTIFSEPLFWLLELIHSFIGNWGWAIVLLTVLIKLVFFKLTEAQYRSMAKMRKLQPRIQTLRERYGSDKQRLNQEMMKIYKNEKVNPLGGCLPILIQIPIFIALYWVLLESVELRQAPFMLWIKDLSAPDPYFVLPVLNGIFMFITQKLSPSPLSDPMQQKIMMSLPIVFSVMFAFFQSGLVLYWTINSGLSLLQQWIITRRIEGADVKR